MVSVVDKLGNINKWYEIHYLSQFLFFEPKWKPYSTYTTYYNRYSVTSPVKYCFRNDAQLIIDNIRQNGSDRVYSEDVS